MPDPWYRHAYRRMLMDMHIPDWDPRFLSRYDPAEMAALYEKANLTGVMFYCQSHVGLCYWPTKTGAMHANLKGRDIVGEMMSALHARGMAACAYYSVIYNNWAFLEHPDWRMVSDPEDPLRPYGQSRYGHCCPNNPGYRAFARAQAEELAGGYDFDGFFFDMTFYPGVCLCEHCRNAFSSGTGHGIPAKVDWLDPLWCSFQAARERWIDEFARDLTGAVKRVKPGMSVYHNFTPACLGWMTGCPFKFAEHHDYLGGDFYGDPLEQLTISKLMTNLTPNRPAEFMTSRCVNLRDHVRLKGFEKMRAQAFAATLFSSAFLFIDAVDPIGTADPDIYDRIGRIFAETAPYEPFLGGDPVEDIAVYFSNESKADLLENGAEVGPKLEWRLSTPHSEAVRGVCRTLQRAHVPFGVITRKQLGELNRYSAVVLPNLLRMDNDEVNAFRTYVAKGGALYASGRTSLLHTRGGRESDFMLADVFGCHAGEDVPSLYYVKPCEPDLAAAIAPQGYVSVVPRLVPSMSVKVDPGDPVVTLGEHVEGLVLATVTWPYDAPEAGTVLDRHWSSIHSSPPWDDTARPAIVEHRFGEGRAIYSAAPIEAVDAEANEALMLALLRRLMGSQPLRYGADTHPAVWMNAMHRADAQCVTVGFLHYPADLPPVPIDEVPFFLRPPKGRRFVRLLRLPEKAPVAFTTDSDGTLRAMITNLELFDMLQAETDPL